MDGIINLLFDDIFPLEVVHAIWRVPLIVTMRPRKAGSERSKHVIQGPAKNDRVVDVNVLHYRHSCIANT